MRQVCESYGGRRIDCLRNVSKKEGRRCAALYQASRKGRSSKLRRSERKGRSWQRLDINSVREGRQGADNAASKLDSGALGEEEEEEGLFDYAIIVHLTLSSADSLHLEKRWERWWGMLRCQVGAM